MFLHLLDNQTYKNFSTNGSRTIGLTFCSFTVILLLLVEFEICCEILKRLLLCLVPKSVLMYLLYIFHKDSLEFETSVS